jgi:hypothetical protein
LDHFLAGYAADSYSPSGNLALELSESGLLLLGVTPDVVKQTLFESTKNLSIIINKFSNKHWFGSPTKANAEAKAQELLKEMQDKFPLFMHRIQEMKIKFEKNGGTWSYGELVLATIPLARTSHLLALPLVIDISADNFDPSGWTQIPVKSMFFQGFLAMLSALSFKKKIQLLLREDLPAANWKFMFEDGPRMVALTLNELILAAIYDDLKTEFFVHDINLSRFKTITNMLEDIETSQAPKFAKILFSLVYRMQNSTR